MSTVTPLVHHRRNIRAEFDHIEIRIVLSAFGQRVRTMAATHDRLGADVPQDRGDTSFAG
jgi:hypothetical protein